MRTPIYAFASIFVIILALTVAPGFAAAATANSAADTGRNKSPCRGDNPPSYCKKTHD